MDDQERHRLLLTIAHCPIMERLVADPKTEHPCAKVVRYQQSDSLEDHQVPEPWSGHLERAPILFLSSNPSYGPAPSDEYPRAAGWPDEEIVHYFENRFRGGRRLWIKDCRYGLQNGRYPGHTRFWSEVRNRAAELLGRPAAEVVCGEDYALTEVVHCKSPAKVGVEEAFDACAQRYLHAVLAHSVAKVIVCVAAREAEQIRRLLQLPPDGPLVGPIELGGRPRHVVFLGTAGSGLPRRIEKVLTPEQREQLYQVLGVVPRSRS